MRAKGLTAVAVLGALTLAACERAAEPAPSTPAAFSHAMTVDLSGYYMPSGPVRTGRWSLDRIFIGQAADFDSWEEGSRDGAFAPVLLQFEEAGTAPATTVRVRPTAYSVTDRRVTFEGQSAELGHVRFEGRLDLDALATARRNLGTDGPVLTGTVTAAGQTLRDVRLRWWMGD